MDVLIDELDSDLILDSISPIRRESGSFSSAIADFNVVGASRELLSDSVVSGTAQRGPARSFSVSDVSDVHQTFALNALDLSGGAHPYPSIQFARCTSRSLERLPINDVTPKLTPALPKSVKPRGKKRRAGCKVSQDTSPEGLDQISKLARCFNALPN